LARAWWWGFSGEYGDLFDESGGLKEIPHYFIPGTAKTLSQYFQRKKNLAEI
jgi:hypothetical protein